MPLPMDDKELRKYIEAFADGELDVETNLRVLERMAMNPQATQRVMHQQELRKLVDRSLREQSPPVPAALRSQIEAIARDAAAASRTSTTPAHDHASRYSLLARLRHWAPALAAIILFAVGLFLWLNRSGTSSEPAPSSRTQVVNFKFEDPISRTDLLEEKRISIMANRHNNCSKQIQTLYKADQFQGQLTEVPAKIAAYLGPQIHMPVPDLTALGYEYQGTGACSLPNGTSVHLLYRPINPNTGDDSLSLWVRPASADHANIDEGKLYRATAQSSPHQVMVWRQGEAIFYLLGGPRSPLSDAASSLYASR